MNLHLTADDLRRYEQASRAMLAPLAAETADEWRLSVNETVRDLVGGDQSISLLPKGQKLFLSEESPDMAALVEAFVTDYAPGGLVLTDPVVQLWQKMRREARMELFSWSANEQMIGRAGYRMQDSPMVSEVLGAFGVQDFVGLHPDAEFGDVLVWVLFRKKDQARFGEGTMELLRTLLPSLKAGLATLSLYDAQRQSLDQLSEAVIVFGIDRRELHRNTSFVRLCGADPEQETILGTVRSIANSLHPLVFPGRRSDRAPAARTVTTRTASYDLKGTLLPHGAFGSEPTVMITVTRQGVQLPDPEVLCERFGLSKREAEVALLLAEGLSNAEVSDRLFISPHTARRHTANCFEKLGVNTRKGLTLLFLQA